MAQYANELEFIGEGVEACWQNARDLLKYAKLVHSHENCGLALSLAVISMEEIGKLLMIDGLLFAKEKDERTIIFQKGYKSHKLKLQALDIFPILLKYLAHYDERYRKEPKFRYTIVNIIRQYQHDRMALIPWIGETCDLVELDQWKQKGFYSHYDSNWHFIRPIEINKEFSGTVIQLAYRIVDAVDFVLNKNIDRYKKRIAAMRNGITEYDLQMIRDHAREIAGEILERPD
ncbi:MAG: AbiV family abortive infection protein [Dehalococcoidia bacterium]